MQDTTLNHYLTTTNKILRNYVDFKTPYFFVDIYYDDKHYVLDIYYMHLQDDLIILAREIYDNAPNVQDLYLDIDDAIDKLLKDLPKDYGVTKLLTREEQHKWNPPTDDNSDDMLHR